MSTRTKMIVLLVVVALLFVVSLVLGLFVNQRGGGQPSDSDAMRDSWVSVLGGLSALAPRIELGGLRCNGQRVDRPFELTEDKPACTIRIPRDRDEDYRKADLEVLGTDSTVYVFAQFEEDDFPQRDRDRRKCFLEEDDLRAFHLEVRYEPDDGSGGDWECWLEQERKEPIAVTVMEGGGTLSLTCRGCDAAARRVIRMQME